MKSFSVFSVIAVVAFLCLDCENNKEQIWGNDPEGAESIYECGITSDTEDFTIEEVEDPDGSKCVRIVHQSFPKSYHYRLFSPNGNLRIIAFGSEQQCGMSGYRMDYDADGTICNVINLGEHNDDKSGKNGVEESSVAIMKRWLRESLIVEPEGSDSTFLRRDENGNITSMRDIDIPYGCRARLFIREWGPFWYSDVHGGLMGFFVMVEHMEHTEGSYVDYLFYEGKLIAELAYWKGVFIKARTYNQRGVMVNMYSDRDIDIVAKAYEDYMTDNPMWYVDD